MDRSLIGRTFAVALAAATLAASAGALPADPAAADLATRRAELERRVAADPDSAALRLGLAELLVRLGEEETALAVYRAAAERAAGPAETASAHTGIAQLEQRRQRWSEAAEHYQLALAADPQRRTALEGFATLLAGIGRYRDAIPYYGLLIAADPDRPGPWLAGGTAMILAGEYTRASIALETAHRRFPDELNILDLLARHLAAAPDPAARDGRRAVELAEKLVAAVPTAESRETLAMAYAQAGDHARAVEVQEELLSGAGPETAAAARWRANLERYRSGRPCCAEETPAASGAAGAPTAPPADPAP